MSLRKDLAWLSAALIFAATVLPFLVYYTGTLTLGEYSPGGPGQFFRDFYRDLLRLRGAPWLLLLGPAVFVIIWRLLVAALWRSGPGPDRRAAAPSDRQDALPVRRDEPQRRGRTAQEGRPRIDPTIG